MDVLGLEQLAQHESIYLGLSGGLDSMVLLDYLAKQPVLRPKLHAIHVHHGVSPHADAWLKFCEQQCQARSIPCSTHFLQMKQAANFEAHARRGRYQVFLDQTQVGDALVLAHHLDDQIETFFLNAIRGTGLMGLAAMPQFRDFSQRIIYRPFIHIARKELVAYANANQISWVEDESNLDLSYSRNFLRGEILPRIAAHWPNYHASMAHTIEDCQHQLAMQFAQFSVKMVEGRVLAKDILAGLSQEEIYTYLRLWCKKNGCSPPSRKILDQIWQQFFLAPRRDANPWVRWGQVGLRAYSNHLYLEFDGVSQPKPQSMRWDNFPHRQGSWEAKQVVSAGLHINPDIDKVEIRYREGGERILYRGQHRCLKKLMQALEIPPWRRTTLPLIYVNGELQALLGYIDADQKPLHAGQYCYQMMNMSQ